MLKYITFYRKQRELFVGTSDVASVAVLRSYPSITYHNSGAGLCAILAEQALIQARMPFTLVSDERLMVLTPAKCKVLLLPDSECLSDEQIAAIKKYVEAGGGLVVTGRSGLYDAWRRQRVMPGLEGLVDWQVPVGSEIPLRATSASLFRKEFGRGRVAYIPKIEFDGALPPSEPYFVLIPKFWKRPANWRELVDAVDWAARNDIALRVAGPDFLGANLVEQFEKRRRLVHLVNYNFTQVPMIENIEVRCSVPEGNPARSVRLYSPGRDGADTLIFRMEGSEAVFTVPRLNAYCVVTIEW
jgi:hypothetical protein